MRVLLFIFAALLPPAIAKAEPELGLSLGYYRYHFDEASTQGPTASVQLGYGYTLPAPFRVGVRGDYQVTRVVDRTVTAGPSVGLDIEVKYERPDLDGPFIRIGQFRTAVDASADTFVNGSRITLGWEFYAEPQLFYVVELAIMRGSNSSEGINLNAEAVRIGTRYRF